MLDIENRRSKLLDDIHRQTEQNYKQGLERQIKNMKDKVSHLEIEVNKLKRQITNKNKQLKEMNHEVEKRVK